MFFPKFSRHDEVDYHNERSGFYADYRKNYEKIAKDCKERCAYCDITIAEYGGDEMQLDHFRPRKYFKHLTTHPYNLYLACPKCNGLKKDDWPADRQDDKPTFSGAFGYIDRVSEDVSAYFSVGPCGKIFPLNDPATYIVKKLHLNRNSRVNVRRKRVLDAKRHELTEQAKLLLISIKDELKAGTLTANEALQKYDLASAIVIKLASVT